jgi:hypothetical protein
MSHTDCPDYGKKGAGNIVLKEFYGKNNAALLKCRTCGHCFSETCGTPFFGLITLLNLTIRNSLARFVRKTMNCSKILKRHTHAFNFFQAWYNFVKPHKSLRLEVNQGIKRWVQRTPAMAEGLTDHIWTLKELMTFRVPVQ